MKFHLFTVSICFFAIAVCGFAQSSTDARAVLGQWEGESICTIKDSPCHDEHVIYRITQDATAPEKLALAAFKIVNGEEQYMGDLDCRYMTDKSELRCHFKPTDSWAYTINGDSMKGTLTINGNTLYRRIDVRRTKATSAK